MMISSKNMQYAFQVEYPNEAINNANSERLNRELIDVLSGARNSNVLADGLKYAKEDRAKVIEQAGALSFMMRVLYPGLLMGTGYPHMTGKMEGEIQLGFSFDAVTGLPYYPGSSLKGVLRNPFDHTLNGDEQSSEYAEYILELFHKHSAEKMDADKLKAFTEATFSGLISVTEESTPMMERDIFYDSYPIGYFKKGSVSKIVGIDHITPHLDINTHKPAPLQNPIPLTFLRVMPDTCFIFQMKLNDFKIDGVTYATGYGNLKPVEDESEISINMNNRYDDNHDVGNNSASPKTKSGKSTTVDDHTIGTDHVPLCKNCGKRHVTYNKATKNYGNYCEECLEEKRAEKEAQGNQVIQQRDKKNKHKKKQKSQKYLSPAERLADFIKRNR